MTLETDRTRFSDEELDALIANGDVELGTFTDDELALFAIEIHLTLYPEDGRVLAAAARSLVARGYAAQSDDRDLVLGAELGMVAHAREASRTLAFATRRTGDEVGGRSMYLLSPRVALEDEISGPGAHVFRVRPASSALADLTAFVSSPDEEAAELPDRTEVTGEAATAILAESTRTTTAEVHQRTSDGRILYTPLVFATDADGAMWMMQPIREGAAALAQPTDSGRVAELLASLTESH